MFIYDEKAHAEEIIRNGFKSGFPFDDLMILAKYFRNEGNKEKDVTRLVFEVCEKQSYYNENFWYNKIKRAISKSKKYDLRVPVDIPITINELNRIRKLNDYRLEKVLFVMLVVGKYRRMTNISKKESDSKNYYTSNKISEYIRMAHVSQKKGECISGYFKSLGYMETIESTNSILLKYSTTEDNSEVSILVTDIFNIIDFYKPHCETCGKELVKNSNRQKMCSECWNEKRKKDISRNVRNFRNKDVIS